MTKYLTKYKIITVGTLISIITAIIIALTS